MQSATLDAAVCRYHTGCGFYINSALVFAAITATIWVYLLLALTGILTFPCGPDNTQICSTINGAHVVCGVSMHRRAASPRVAAHGIACCAATAPPAMIHAAQGIARCEHGLLHICSKYCECGAVRIADRCCFPFALHATRARVALKHGPIPLIAVGCLPGHVAVTAAGQVFQIGLLTLMSYAMELLLELGVVATAQTLAQQLLQGARSTGHTLRTL